MDEVTILDYQVASGVKPYRAWFEGLRDRQAKAVIEGRIRKVRRGLFGNVRSVGDGVFELKIYFGPGYRVYYLKDGSAMVILLCGGDKDSQDDDIRRARQFARDYWRRQL